METLIGFTFRDWILLLRSIKFEVDRDYRSIARRILFHSMLTSFGRGREKRCFGKEIANVLVDAPIFIIGHWRSGTTLLHHLVIQDEQFGYPNLFQTTHPHTFLIREQYVREYDVNYEAQTRSMDQVNVTFQSPGEDESALAVLSLRSSLLGWMFPRYQHTYDKYLTFEDVEKKDIERWETALTFFSKKLSLRYNRPIVFKSPTHTSKIRYILKLYPEARFIHIRRNPSIVFQSTRNMYRKMLPLTSLQDFDLGGLDDYIIDCYQTMYNAYFKDVSLIPYGQHVEVSFEKLEKDHIGQLSKIYESLNLPGFADIEQGFKKYFDSLQGYQKSKYKPMPEDLQMRVAEAWERNFELWNYPL